MTDFPGHGGGLLRTLISVACPGKGCLGEKHPWLLGWVFRNFSTPEKPRGYADSSADQVRGSCPDTYFATLLKT